MSVFACKQGEANNAQVRVTWEPPSDQVGKPVGSYKIRSPYPYSWKEPASSGDLIDFTSGTVRVYSVSPEGEDGAYGSTSVSGTCADTVQPNLVKPSEPVIGSSTIKVPLPSQPSGYDASHGDEFAVYIYDNPNTESTTNYKAKCGPWNYNSVQWNSSTACSLQKSLFTTNATYYAKYYMKDKYGSPHEYSNTAQDFTIQPPTPPQLVKPSEPVIGSSTIKVPLPSQPSGYDASHGDEFAVYIYDNPNTESTTNYKAKCGPWNYNSVQWNSSTACSLQKSLFTTNATYYAKYYMKDKYDGYDYSNTAQDFTIQPPATPKLDKPTLYSVSDNSAELYFPQAPDEYKSSLGNTSYCQSTKFAIFLNPNAQTGWEQVLEHTSDCTQESQAPWDRLKTFSNLTPGQTYYAKASVKDTFGGQGAWSDPTTFTTTMPAPILDPPTLISVGQDSATLQFDSVPNFPGSQISQIGWNIYPCSTGSIDGGGCSVSHTFPAATFGETRSLPAVGTPNGANILVSGHTYYARATLTTTSGQTTESGTATPIPMAAPTTIDSSFLSQAPVLDVAEDYLTNTYATRQRLMVDMPGEPLTWGNWSGSIWLCFAVFDNFEYQTSTHVEPRPDPPGVIGPASYDMLAATPAGMEETISWMTAKEYAAARWCWLVTGGGQADNYPSTSHWADAGSGSWWTEQRDMLLNSDPAPWSSHYDRPLVQTGGDRPLTHNRNFYARWYAQGRIAQQGTTGISYTTVYRWSPPKVFCAIGTNANSCQIKPANQEPPYGP